MKRAKKKKSIFRSTFYQIYFAVLGLFVIAVAIGLFWLNGVLVDYEQSRPIYFVEEAARLFTDLDLETMYRLDTNVANIAEGDHDFYIENIGKLTQGKTVTWNEAFSINEDEAVYNILMDGEKFATMTLMHSGETTPGGRPLWKLSRITTNVSAEKPKAEEAVPEQVIIYTYKVKVPKDYTVTVDGKNAAEIAISTEESKMEYGELAPEEIECPMYTTYTFDLDTLSPQILVADTAGNPVTLTPGTDDHSYTYAYPEDMELKAICEEGVCGMAKNIAKCFVDAYSKNAILGKCVYKGPAYRGISGYSTTWVTHHKSCTFENMQTSDWYRYSDDCFSVRVSFTFVRKFSGATRKFDTVYRLCFVRKDGKVKLYSMNMS